MIVDDDGSGLPSTDAGSADKSAKHLGSLGIRDCLALVSGTLEVESTPGHGCTILVRVPL